MELSDTKKHQCTLLCYYFDSPPSRGVSRLACKSHYPLYLQYSINSRLKRPACKRCLLLGADFSFKFRGFHWRYLAYKCVASAAVFMPAKCWPVNAKPFVVGINSKGVPP